jgi:hypothetical protein
MMKPMAIDLSRFNNAAYLESRICHTIKSRKSDWVGKPSLVTQNKKDKKGIRTILQH